MGAVRFSFLLCRGPDDGDSPLFWNFGPSSLAGFFFFCIFFQEIGGFMKLKLLPILALMLPLVTLAAEVGDVVKFDAPPQKVGRDVMQAFANRKSGTSFSGRPVPEKDLGNVLWAANGINRPKTGMRTAPSALNKQDIDLYVFDQKSVFKYNPKDHSMSVVVKGDHRSLFTERMKTPVIILLVSDISKFSDGMGTEDDHRRMGAFDAGIVSQNISLYCSALGIATRVRASMDGPGIQKLLGLSEKQIPMLNHAIGYNK